MGIKRISSTEKTKICKYLRRNKPLLQVVSYVKSYYAFFSHISQQNRKRRIQGRPCLSYCHFLCFKSGTAGQVSVKSVTNYMPLKGTGSYIFYFLYLVLKRSRRYEHARRERHKTVTKANIISIKLYHPNRTNNLLYLTSAWKLFGTARSTQNERA